MADNEATEEEQAAKGGGNKKMIIIFAVALLLAVGGSVAGTMMLLGGDEEEVAEADVEPQNLQAIYHSMRPAFVVNYLIANKPRYLQTELSVMARDPSVIDGVIQHTPLVRSRVVDYLTDQAFTELQTQEGKEALQAGLVDLLNDVLKEQKAPQGVEAVLFSSFVMQ